MDLPRERAICFTAVSEAGPTFVSISEMDKWTAISPESKRQLDNYIKALRRRAEQCKSNTQSQEDPQEE
jgi:hypothetical protein